MMHYASQGARNAARKGYSALIHHGGYGLNGPPSTNQLTSQVRAYSSAPLNSSFRTRSPPYRLFSVSKNFFQRLYSYLTTPGLRVPTNLSQAYGIGAQSLRHPVRGYSINSGLSLPTRHALRNNALQRQANTFLPRAPGLIPARCGGVARVGLGSARNFGSARPIFQNLAQNVPVAGRSLYELDWDTRMRKEQEYMHIRSRKSSQDVQKAKERIMPTKMFYLQNSLSLDKGNACLRDHAKEEVEHYFSVPQVAPVVTYLLIPLAPTPTLRHPLQLDPEISGRGPRILPPLSDLSTIHASHSTHALRLNTLFTRLDQADVWARGDVHYSAYSQGDAHQRKGIKTNADDGNEEGVCTILKIEFVGWTKGEVRGVIGESGTGWCALDEVFRDETASEDELFDLESLSSEPSFGSLDWQHETHLDPARSFVLPSLDLSSSYQSDNFGTSLQSIPSGMERDPWVDEYPYSSSSASTSYSDLPHLVIDPLSFDE